MRLRGLEWLSNLLALTSCCLPSGSDGSLGRSGYSSSSSCTDPYYTSGNKREYCDEQPTVFAHGSYQPSVDHVGEKVLIFSCDPGYVLLGSYVLTCQCGTWSHPFPRCAARDCLAHLHSGHKNSGVYGIAPSGEGVVYVYCDMTSGEGGWTIIQRRVDGTLNFYQDWKKYDSGFGLPEDNFWIGLYNIFHLTGPSSELLVNMEWDEGTQSTTARYRSFRVGGPDENYLLLISGFSGNTGDALSSSHNQKFSSYDSDNDSCEKHCAVDHQGAWWYGNCSEANLNGRYGHEFNQGIIWTPHNGATLFLTYVEMKVRRRVKN